MHHTKTYTFLLLLLFISVSCSKKNNQHQLSVSSSGISVSVNPENGSYTIHAKKLNWTLRGSVGKSLSDVKTSSGKDSIGSYKMIQFKWKADNNYVGTIRRYDDKPVVLFSLTTPHKADSIKANFPSFTSFPSQMHHYSFGNNAFAPHKFNLVNTSSPWLFFNNQDEAFILSPASDFIVSKMKGGQQKIASGLNAKLTNLPAHFTHKSILVLGRHIHSAWAQWGKALRSLYGRKRPDSESDPFLKYYGYWTDNGAYYYYHYDKSKGYPGTLLAVKKQWQKEGIPIGYMQLDSWWYYKSKYGPNSSENTQYLESTKPRTFQVKGSWNNSGGMITYRPDKAIFPHGFKAFHQKIQLPFLVHNRWIDPRSPYHKNYKITGYAATGPKFWNAIANYIKSVDVLGYEQDWLNVIYNHTPKMASDLSVGNAFTGNMAKAMKKKGIDMQYCMAMPRFFMQGVKYNNLTTARTSDDRFEPVKWGDFIYTSQLAYAMGIWPWSDVFMSRETGNMIVSVLSAGAVGTGDKLGEEDKANILKAARTDGVLVKPDAALLPMDSDYINEANHVHRPMLAYTYTKQNNIRTNYVFVFAPKGSTPNQYSFTPSNADLGMKGEVAVYNPLSGTVKKMNADSTFTGSLSNDGTITKKMKKTGDTKGGSYRYTYYMIAPVTPIGIGFLGDESKIAATGRQRISTLKAGSRQLTAQVEFAKGESSVHLQGYYEKPFTVDNGQLKLHSDKHMFVLTVTAPHHSDHVTIHFTPK
jgi:hypothetical protein